jgi:hypothetical protein
MCLQLSSEETRLNKATKDIVCYKRLDVYEKPDITKYSDGAAFKGVIKEIKCKGHLTVEDGKLYFCTNNSALNGSNCDDKKGYKYSWVFDDRVTEINGEAPVLITTYETIYQNFTVKIGETYTSSLEKINDTVYMGLHSYANIGDTQHSILGNEVIAKCIIPKGASYYKGRFDGYTSYASDTLTYVEIVA